MTKRSRFRRKPEEVEVEEAGKSYKGTYRVDSGIVTVSSACGTKSTQVGSSDSGRLAKALLLELVVAGRAARD